MDFYAMLGVTTDATREEIRQAYRRKVLRYHPDVCRLGDRRRADTRMKKLNHAAAVLLDGAARARYDALRRNWRRASPFRRPARDDFWPFGVPKPAPAAPPSPPVAHRPFWRTRDGVVALVAACGNTLLALILLVSSPTVPKGEPRFAPVTHVETSGPTAQALDAPPSDSSFARPSTPRMHRGVRRR
jgi:curved DNA-binding protein CbpA